MLHWAAQYRRINIDTAGKSKHLTSQKAALKFIQLFRNYWSLRAQKNTTEMTVNRNMQAQKKIITVKIAENSVFNEKEEDSTRNKRI